MAKDKGVVDDKKTKEKEDVVEEQKIRSFDDIFGAIEVIEVDKTRTEKRGQGIDTTQRKITILADFTGYYVGKMIGRWLKDLKNKQVSRLPGAICSQPVDKETLETAMLSQDLVQKLNNRLQNEGLIDKPADEVMYRGVIKDVIVRSSPTDSLLSDVKSMSRDFGIDLIRHYDKEKKEGKLQICFIPERLFEMVKFKTGVDYKNKLLSGRLTDADIDKITKAVSDITSKAVFGGWDKYKAARVVQQQAIMTGSTDARGMHELGRAIAYIRTLFNIVDKPIEQSEIIPTRETPEQQRKRMGDIIQDMRMIVLSKFSDEEKTKKILGLFETYPTRVKEYIASLKGKIKNLMTLELNLGEEDRHSTT